MSHQRCIECGSHISVGACHIGKIVNRHIAGDIAAIVGASGFLQSQSGALVDNAALTEFDFAAIIEARNTAEGEHKVEVFSPLSGAFVEAVAIVRTGAIVVRIHIHHIVGGIVVVFVAVHSCAPHAGDVVERVVHREVDYAQSGRHAHVGSVIVVAIEDGIGGSRHCRSSFMAIVGILLFA